MTKKFLCFSLPFNVSSASQGFPLHYPSRFESDLWSRIVFPTIVSDIQTSLSKINPPFIIRVVAAGNTVKYTRIYVLIDNCH